MMTEQNPVVLLSGGVWHVVEDGRTAQVALCGQPLRDRQAHSRLRTIGPQNLCEKCRTLLPHEGGRIP